LCGAGCTISDFLVAFYLDLPVVFNNETDVIESFNKKALILKSLCFAFFTGMYPGWDDTLTPPWEILG